MLHDVGNNRDCDVDVDHRNNTIALLVQFLVVLPHLRLLAAVNASVASIVLLERVFLRLGSAETDEQLEASLAKFLGPVLLKLASQTDGVRKKVAFTACHVFFV